MKCAMNKELYYFVANGIILAFATTFIGMIIYGPLFVLSLIFWLAFWQAFNCLACFISARICNWLLQIKGEMSSWTEVRFTYFGAAAKLCPFILVFALLEIVASFWWVSMHFLIFILFISFIRYIQIIVSRLSTMFSLQRAERIMIAVISLLPEVLFYLFLRMV